MATRLASKRNEKSFNWMPSMHQRIFTPMLIIAILAAEKSAGGSFDQTPNNTVAAAAAANLATYFNCSTFNSPMDPRDLVWVHYHLSGTGQRIYVYDDGKIMAPYKNKFGVEVDMSSGTCNLLVLRPELQDAGKYECIDARESVGVSAELTVYEPNLVCESDKNLSDIVGPTECDVAIPPDEMQLSCTVSFSGVYPPPMKWIKATDPTNPLDTKCAIKDGQLICNTTVTATLQKGGSVYTCQITTGNFSCSLEFKEILYVFSGTSLTKSDKEEDETCVANASKQVPCLYKWYRDYTTLVSSDSTLKLNETGLYACRAQCTIRNGNCAFIAMAINFHKTENRLLWLLLPLLLLLILAIAAIVVWKFKSEAHKKRSNNEEERRQGVEVFPMLIMEDDLQSRADPTVLTDANVSADPNVSADANVSAYANVSTDPNASAVLHVVGISKVSVEYDFQDALSNKVYIDKGLSGDIYGPLQYKGKECVIEQIICSTYQQTPTNERVVSKEEKICSNGRQWMALKHKNLIGFYDVVQRSPAVYIVMEYAAGGSVRKALNRSTKDLSLPLVKDWAIQIAEGMKYLHVNDIIHGSLKCAHVMVVVQEPKILKDTTLKIACKRLIDDDYRGSGLPMEQFAFLPPEVLEGKPYRKEADIWSYGVTVWEILTRKIPYENEKNAFKLLIGICEENLALEIPESYPPVIRGIFKECFDRVPEKRPEFNEILTKLNEIELTFP